MPTPILSRERGTSIAHTPSPQGPARALGAVKSSYAVLSIAPHSQAPAPGRPTVNEPDLGATSMPPPPRRDRQAMASGKVVCRDGQPILGFAIRAITALALLQPVPCGANAHAKRDTDRRTQCDVVHRDADGHANCDPDRQTRSRSITFHCVPSFILEPVLDAQLPYLSSCHAHPEHDRWEALR